MKLSDLESRILSDLSSGNFRFSTHAIQRSDRRQIARADIQRAAQDYKDCWTDKTAVVHVIGPDMSDEEIEVVAGYDGETVVITVIDAS